MLYLKMILRSWRRAWMSSMISMVSLVVGLTCSTLLLLFVLSEYRIARSLGDTQSVFQIETDDSYYTDGSVRSSQVSIKAIDDLDDRYSQIERVVSVVSERCKFIDCVSGVEYVQIYIATPEFADMFDIGVVAGDLHSTLRSSDEVAVTDEFMQQTFGRPARIGEHVKLSVGGNMWINGVQLHAVELDLVITTILANSEKTPFSYKFLMPMNEKMKQRFNEGPAYSFVSLKDPDNVNELQVLIDADSTRVWGKNKLYFRPFEEVYLNGATQSKWNSEFIQRRDPSFLSIGLTVALLVLVIAVFNYVNITMTRARGRLRNLASQRIFGASKWAVRSQTILDTLLMIVLSFGVSLLIINAILPSFNSFMGSYIALSDMFADWTWLSVLGLLLLVAAFSSAYILIKLNTSNIIETLKNPMGRGVKISSVMVVAQFVISIALVAGSMNISRQLNYVSNSLPAFRSVAEIKSSDKQNISRDFFNHVASMSWTEGCTAYAFAHGSSMSSDGRSVNGMAGGNEMFSFYDLHLVEGRMFQAHDSSDCVIVNEALVREFGLTPPVVGQNFEFMEKYRIVGVVEDFMYEDAHKKIQPLIITTDDYAKHMVDFKSFYVKVLGDPNNRIDEIQTMWREKYPDRSGLEIKLLPQIIRELHVTDERMRVMVGVMMVVSMILTAIGLFGLAFYTVARRTREIAIRKVHGSTSSQVVLLLCRTFVAWVGVAALIAFPVAYFVSDWWLSDFVYHVGVEWWVFALTVVLVSVVAFVTVIFQTLSAARANPANSIKAE